MISIDIKTYGLEELEKPDKKTILRYAGDPLGESLKNDHVLSDLLDSVISEGENVIAPRICSAECAVSVTGDRVDTIFGEISSALLAKHLEGCSSAVFMAATIGIGLDRIVTAKSRVSPAAALLADAYGSERVEALCDHFENGLRSELSGKGCSTVSRYSPGYGDFGLEYQKNIIGGLQCQKHIGLTLNSCLMMTPTKSVTAVIGIKNGAESGKRTWKCRECGMTECPFRNAEEEKGKV